MPAKTTDYPALLAFAGEKIPFSEQKYPLTDKIGGIPVFVSHPGFQQPICDICSNPLFFVCQTIAPLDPSTVIDVSAPKSKLLTSSRLFYVFGCNTRTCSINSKGWKVYRCSYNKNHNKNVKPNEEIGIKKMEPEAPVIEKVKVNVEKKSNKPISKFAEFAKDLISDDLAGQFSGIFGLPPDEVPDNLKGVIDTIPTKLNKPVEKSRFKVDSTSQKSFKFFDGLNSDKFDFGLDEGNDDILSFGNSNKDTFGSIDNSLDVNEILNMIETRDKEFKWNTTVFDSDSDSDEKETQNNEIEELSKQLKTSLNIKKESTIDEKQEIKKFVMPMATGTIFPCSYIEFDDEIENIENDDYISSDDDADSISADVIAKHITGKKQDEGFNDGDEDDLKEDNNKIKDDNKYAKKYDHELNLLKDFVNKNGLSFDIDGKIEKLMDKSNESKEHLNNNNKKINKKKPNVKLEKDSEDEILIGGDWDREVYENTKVSGINSEFAKFHSHVAADPGQVIRYDRKNKPLVMKGDTLTDISKKMNKCKYCGSKKVFEFQIMPCILSALNVGQYSIGDSKFKMKNSSQQQRFGKQSFDNFVNNHTHGMDFASVLIYCCSNNCTPLECYGKDKNIPITYTEETSFVIVD